jgi:outer membrane protein assembly factor BamB
MSRWQQFHANGSSQGFIPVSSTPANQSKWSIEVGPVGYGSPVIGDDGTVYIGTLKSELVAVNPDGALKWKRVLGRRGDKITGSPAVGKDGNIYVVTTRSALVLDHRTGEEHRRKEIRSTLHSIDPAGTIRWSSEFPENSGLQGYGGYTMSSPKVWSTVAQELFIFVPSIFVTSGYATDILVFNQSGTLIHRASVSSYPPAPVTGSGPGFSDILEGVWDFISSPVDFDPSGVGPTLEQQFGIPEPTLAVVDFPPFANRPLIVIEDNYKKLAAFRFQNQRLQQVWEKVSQNGRLRSAPAVFSNGLLVLGQRDGSIAMYDVASGRELWKPWYKADKPVLSPPASFGRQIYFVAEKKLTVLDGNSDLLHKHTLIGKCLGTPALSAKHLYVSANDGFYTFSFDLANFSKNSDVIGGVSSPSIADDGTVYIVDLRKTLWAFGGSTTSSVRKPPKRIISTKNKFKW